MGADDAAHRGEGAVTREDDLATAGVLQHVEDMRLTDIVLVYVAYTAVLGIITALIVLSVWGGRKLRHG